MSDFERAYRESMEARIRQLEAELARLREEWSAAVSDVQAELIKSEGENDRLREGWGKEIENAERLANENRRLREENASLVDRHNRESHGTASHEAMAYDQLKAENARLREERDKLHALYNRAQDDASREAEIRVNQGFELARLREENEGLSARNADLENEIEEGLLLYTRDKAIAQRDTLLAALRKIEREAQDPAVDLHTMMMVVGIARAAIAEVEGKP